MHDTRQSSSLTLVVRLRVFTTLKAEESLPGATRKERLGQSSNSDSPTSRPQA